MHSYTVANVRVCSVHPLRFGSIKTVLLSSLENQTHRDKWGPERHKYTSGWLIQGVLTRLNQSSGGGVEWRYILS